MTDNDIIKAFECCNNDGCENCPNRPTCCEIDIPDEILNLINRQKAEIELMRGYIHRNNLEYDLLSYKRMVSIDDE